MCMWLGFGGCGLGLLSAVLGVLGAGAGAGLGVGCGFLCCIGLLSGA